MDNKDEFEFWCGEYRDNPVMSAAATQNLLNEMCERGNPFARRERDHPTRIASDPPDLVELMALNVNFGPIDELIPSIDQSGFSTRDEATYPLNWIEIATAIKDRREWRCELCKFQKRGSGLLHVHHIDRDKSNNCLGNLQVLCAICHGVKHGATLGEGSESERAELNQYHEQLRRRS